MAALAFLAAGAAAEPVRFTPDRPGVGDHTGTPGAGHVMIEGGVVIVAEPGSFVAGSLGRLGIGRVAEVRVRLPTVGYEVGLPTLGSIGVGAKIGGALSDAWSLSVVPELAVAPDTGLLERSLGVNLALDLGVVGLWGHTAQSWHLTRATTLAGGGIGVPLPFGGVFAHGAHSSAGESFGGLGGWWAVTRAFQVDLGADVFESGALAMTLGASVGR